MAAACGCADSSSGGFMAREVTNPAPPAAAAASEYKTFAELSHGSVVAGSEVEFDDEEEKKVEERTPVAPPVKARRSPASGDDEKLSFATSAFNHSVAASGTTVMHSNTAVQLQGRLYSDEDFLSEVAATPLHVDPPGSKVRSDRESHGTPIQFCHSHLFLINDTGRTEVDQEKEWRKEELGGRSSQDGQGEVYYGVEHSQ
jgi:hypothetical protein